MRTYFQLRAGRADVTLTHPVTLPTERILTSGGGGGITFRIDPRFFPRLGSTLRVRPADLGDRMRDLLREGGYLLGGSLNRYAGQALELPGAL